MLTAHDRQKLWHMRPWVGAKITSASTNERLVRDWLLVALRREPLTVPLLSSLVDEGHGEAGKVASSESSCNQ